MAAKSVITGQRRVFNNLMIQKSKFLARAAIAVEKTAVDVANHAKANHESSGAAAKLNDDIAFAEAFGAFGSLGSSKASSSGLRYVNRTGTLTRSITPELTKVDFNEVMAQVFTNIEYAPMVELGTSRSRAFPFLFPALVTNQKNFEARMKALKV